VIGMRTTVAMVDSPPELLRSSCQNIDTWNQAWEQGSEAEPLIHMSFCRFPRI